jgi:hypothetical protein
MAEIIWPDSPFLGQLYTSDNGDTWRWNGYGWDFVGGPFSSGSGCDIEPISVAQAQDILSGLTNAQKGCTYRIYDAGVSNRAWGSDSDDDFSGFITTATSTNTFAKEGTWQFITDNRSRGFIAVKFDYSVDTTTGLNITTPSSLDNLLIDGITILEGTWTPPVWDPAARSAGDVTYTDGYANGIRISNYAALSSSTTTWEITDHKIWEWADDFNGKYVDYVVFYFEHTTSGSATNELIPSFIANVSTVGDSVRADVDSEDATFITSGGTESEPWILDANYDPILDIFTRAYDPITNVEVTGCFESSTDESNTVILKDTYLTIHTFPWGVVERLSQNGGGFAYRDLQMHNTKWHRGYGETSFQASTIKDSYFNGGDRSTAVLPYAANTFYIGYSTITECNIDVRWMVSYDRYDHKGPVILETTMDSSSLLLLEVYDNTSTIINHSMCAYKTFGFYASVEDSVAMFICEGLPSLIGFNWGIVFNECQAFDTLINISSICAFNPVISFTQYIWETSKIDISSGKIVELGPTNAYVNNLIISSNLSRGSDSVPRLNKISGTRFQYSFYENLLDSNIVTFLGYSDFINSTVLITFDEGTPRKSIRFDFSGIKFDLSSFTFTKNAIDIADTILFDFDTNDKAFTPAYFNSSRLTFTSNTFYEDASFTFNFSTCEWMNSNWSIETAIFDIAPALLSISSVMTIGCIARDTSFVFDKMRFTAAAGEPVGMIISQSSLINCSIDLESVVVETSGTGGTGQCIISLTKCDWFNSGISTTRGMLTLVDTLVILATVEMRDSLIVFDDRNTYDTNEIGITRTQADVSTILINSSANSFNREIQDCTFINTNLYFAYTTELDASNGYTFRFMTIDKDKVHVRIKHVLASSVDALTDIELNYWVPNAFVAHTIETGRGLTYNPGGGDIRLSFTNAGEIEETAEATFNYLSNPILFASSTPRPLTTRIDRFVINSDSKLDPDPYGIDLIVTGRLLS